MQGEDTPSAGAPSRFVPPAGARLLACFALALAAHVAILATQLARGRLVASRRSAGGLQLIEFDECPPELPHRSTVLAATVAAVPAARQHRDTTIAVRRARPTARSDDGMSQPVTTKATNPVVALWQSAATANADAPGAGVHAAEATAPLTTTDSAVKSYAHVERGHAHGPRLLTAGACGGFFPPRARDDDGAVILALNVRETGGPYAPRVISETPPRQGFGAAALRCASFLKFAPAEDAAGAHVSSISVVRLRFARAPAK
jgi:hypothetical protein